MNITNSSIQYISGNNVKTFKIPKKDRDINFKKWSYNDVIEYIKLNEKRRETKKGTKNSNSRNSRSSTSQNTIKYARLTTAKTNPIINGKKTLEQVKLEAILAANNLGTNSTEYKTAIEQINQYSELILRKYLEDYIQKNPQANTLTLGQLETKFNRLIGEKSNSFIKTPVNYQIINDNSSGMNKFRVSFDYPDNKYTYNPGFKFGLQNRYVSTDDNKYYFGFKIPNEYNVNEVKDKMKSLIDMRKFKNIFYDFDNDKCVLTVDEIDKKRDELIDNHMYPIILTDEDYIYICSDIFEYLLYNSNGQLRDKIYFCQYETFDMNNDYYIINSDLIDEHFIKYFMDNDISYKGKNTDMAFYSKVIDKLISLIGLNRGNYKDIYEYKDLIQSDTNFKDKFKDGEYEKKMDIEGEETIDDNERNRQERERIQKKIKDYQNELNKGKEDEEYVKFDYKLPKGFYDYTEETEEEKQERDRRDRERMEKKIQDNRFGRYNNVVEPEEPKPISPERVKELEKEKETTTEAQPLESDDKEIRPVPPPKPKETDTKEEIKIPIPVPEIPQPQPPKIQKDTPPPLPLPPNIEPPKIQEKPKYNCYIIYYDDSLITQHELNIRGIIFENVNNENDISSVFNGVGDNDSLKEFYMFCFNKHFKTKRDIKNCFKNNLTRIEITKMYFIEGYDFNNCRELFDAAIKEQLKVKLNYEIPDEEVDFSYLDDNIPDDTELLNDNSNNTNEILIKGNKTVYLIYSIFTNFVNPKVLMVGDYDFIDCFKYGKDEYGRQTQDFIKCYDEIFKLENKYFNENNSNKLKDKPMKQLENYVEIISKNIECDNIKLVHYNPIDESILNNDLKMMRKYGTVSEGIKSRVQTTYKKGGDGLGNGIYDSIKDFVNFRKDTRKTLYYLLQRIIALEGDMKTVKNKMVSNDIRTNLNNHNIKYGDSEDEDFDNFNDVRSDEGGNGFTCSRCGMINPKFFKNDYPTLSEFREQFSKL